MRYVKQSTNTIHYIADIRRENPNSSIPDDADCTDFGYEFLIEVEAPVQVGYDAVEGVPINNTQTWELVLKPIVIPQSVTPRQARLALLQATLLDDVELLLANDKAMQIWWEYSLEIERNHPYIITMGTALGITSTQLDELFILAATL